MRKPAGYLCKDKIRKDKESPIVIANIPRRTIS